MAPTSPCGRVHIQFHDSTIASFHLFCFLSFLMVALAGRKAGRGSDEYLKAQTSAGAWNFASTLLLGLIRQDSRSFQSGTYRRTASLESLPVLHCHWLRPCLPVPFEHNGKSGLASSFNFLHH
jgi:hypothetical protein